MTPEFLNLSDSELLHYLAEDWHEQHEGARLEEVAMRFDRMALENEAWRGQDLKHWSAGYVLWTDGTRWVKYTTLEAAIDALELEE